MASHTIAKEGRSYVIRRKSDGGVSFKYKDLRIAMLKFERLKLTEVICHYVVMKMLREAIITKSLTKYEGTEYETLKYVCEYNLPFQLQSGAA